MKLVERPAPHTLGPHGFHQIKATIKVSSTETGVIFGSITYSVKGSDADANIVLSVSYEILDPNEAELTV